MKRFVWAALTALVMAIVPFAGAFADELSSEQAAAAEKVCGEKGFKWQGDRCFTGKTCRLQPDGADGDEAIKTVDGKTVTGCSRVRYLDTVEKKQERKDAFDPDKLEAMCKKSEAQGLGYRWMWDRCYTGKTCTMKPSGKQGFEAIKDGVKGCSQNGPPSKEAIEKYKKKKTKIDI